MVQHRSRLGMVIAIAAALLLTAPPVGAAVPDYQRVIKARSASAGVGVEVGCLQTMVWVSSSDSMFGGRPGRVVKQGLTSVSVTRVDTCAGSSDTALAPAGGPPAGVTVFDGTGQTLDRLRSTPRFTKAWIDVTLPLLDEVSGTTVPVHVDLTWLPVGPYQRDTTSTHARDPGAGIVNSHTQTLMADATVSGTVLVGSELLTFGPSGNATLEQVKYGCQLIRHPRSNTDFSC